MTATGWALVSAAMYCGALGLGLTLHLLGHRPGSRVPDLGSVVGWAMRTATGRVVILLFWSWVGFHFFAR